jgi:hypothetical protein
MSITAPDTVAAGAFVRLTGVIPQSGTTSLQLTRNGTTRTIPLTRNGPNGTWVVRTRMSGNLLATMTRSGIAGPRVFVRLA